ncbi:MAG: DUF3592 domain-containing protein [Streptosporangiales bacterium]|nr:DUF3592 domain-containing protein [Streptosporangiales bacterium]
MNDILGPALFAPLMFAVVGTLFVLHGIRALVEFLSFRRRAVRCEGLVADMRKVWHSGRGSNNSGHYIHYPVLAFRATDGREVQTVAKNGSNPPMHRVGDNVGVLYDPRDPARAYAGRAVSARVLPVLFVVAGGAFAVGGVTMLLRAGVVERLIGAL